MLHFNALAGGFPANIRINVTSPETKMIYLPKAENRTIISLDKTPEDDGWTDRQTDKRTDKQTALAITAVCVARNADAL